MTDMNKLPPSLFANVLWKTESNPIWPVSTLTLHRNLARFPFPVKLEKPAMKQVLQLVKEAIARVGGLQEPTFLDAEELPPLDKEYLYEHFLCCQSFQNTLEGQGFVIDRSSKLLAMINVEEHLQLQIIDTSGDFQKTWKVLSEIEEQIGRVHDYAYSERFGYLSSRPEMAGTGLQVYAFLHLPALIHTGQLAEALLKQKAEGISATGLQGGKEDYVGDYLLLSNQFSLGVDEEKILSTVYTAAIQMMEAEKKARSFLKQTEDAHMKDLVSRAYGLLAHSYQLQTQEALSALSLIKLGIDLEWISGISDSEINTISFCCRRGHLAHQFQLSDADPEEIAKKRSEYLHKELKPATLTSEG